MRILITGAAEAMTMAYHRYHGVDTRIVRIFNSDRVEPTNIGNPNEFTIRELADVVLGWEPKVQLREGIRRTVPYFRELVERDGATARTL